MVKCQILRQCRVSLMYTVIFLTVCVSVVEAQGHGRSPANYVVDDDIIIVPIEYKKSDLQDFHHKHRERFQASKSQIQTWLLSEEYVESFGLKGRGIVHLPTREEKQRFFERNYLRFLNRDFQKATNRRIQKTIQELTADNELASIDNFEAREEIISDVKKSKAGKRSGVKKEVKVGKKKFKFNIQPRVEMGMVRITLKSSYFNMRAWIGINGDQELRFNRSFQSTKTRAQLNYFIDDRRVLASIDQQLSKNITLRLTHDRREGEGVQGNGSELPILYENNVVQVRYNYSF